MNDPAQALREKHAEMVRAREALDAATTGPEVARLFHEAGDAMDTFHQEAVESVPALLDELEKFRDYARRVADAVPSDVIAKGIPIHSEAFDRPDTPPSGADASTGPQKRTGEASA